MIFQLYSLAAGLFISLSCFILGGVTNGNFFSWLMWFLTYRIIFGNARPVSREVETSVSRTNFPSEFMVVFFVREMASMSVSHL